MDPYQDQVDSPATEQNPGVTADAQADATGVSPTPEGDSFDLHQIVDKMTAHDGEGEGADTPAAEADEGAPQEEGAESAEEQEEQDAELPFHKHPRFQQVIAQKNEFKDRAEQTEQQFESFRNEVREVFSGLDQSEAMEALEIARLMKTDPQAALERLSPVYSQVASLNGYLLPDDLQQEVDAGYMTQERAQELAKYRAQQEFQQTRQQSQQQHETQGQQDRVMQEATQGLEELEANWKRADPDFGMKQGPIFDRFAVLMQQRMAQGQPLGSRDEVMQLAEQAKQEVEQRFDALRPKRQAKKTLRSTAPGPAAQPKPQSVMDIINQNIS